MPVRPRWPASILLVRHAESVGNVARLAAEASRSPVIDVAERDMDVSLSERGCEQARALGHWIGGLGRRRPSVVMSSPYVRAASTAELALTQTKVAAPLVLDERLREREFGALDRLTRLGIEQRHPDEAAARARVGKFYYRPPSGESWCDVVLRVRSLLDTVTREHEGRSVMIVTHEVVIFAFRYVIERMTEAQVLALGAQVELANASVTTYVRPRRRHHDGMVLEGFNEVHALAESHVPVTAEPDQPLAPR